MSVYIGRNPIVNDGLILNYDASSPLNYTLSEVEVLVVAGGGGGGAYAAGAGGGAGGVVYNTNYAVTPGSAISVTVGNGGNGGVWSSPSPQNGQNSLFGKLTAVGGGAGGQGWGGNPGSSGGSGGGGAGYDGISTQNYISGGGFTPGQGFSGGRGKGISGNRGAGGGGGGAGGPGGDATNFGAGNGGRGLPFNISGVMRYYGGGGGGGDYGSSGGGNGGVGGGGTQSGGNSSSQTATNGAANTGGGGGGSRSATPDSWNGGNGGSGVVIVRYPGSQKATGGNTIITSGGYTIHTFTSSGTFTPLTSPLNNGSVYGLQDLTKTSNTAVAVNGPTYNTSTSGVINFDGTNDFLTLTNTLVNPGDFTYCAWIYRSVVSPNGYTNVFLSTLQNEQFQLDLTGYPGGFGMYVNGGYNSTTSNVIPLNTWVYVCWQRNGTGLYGYLNGVEQFNPSNGNNFGYSSVSTAVSRVNKIGAYSNGTSYNLNGRLGPVQFYYKALTLNQIQQNFNAQRGRFGV